MNLVRPRTQGLCPMQEKLEFVSKEYDKEHGPQLHEVFCLCEVFPTLKTCLPFSQKPCPQHYWRAFCRHVFTLLRQLQEHLARPHFLGSAGRGPILLPGELLQAPLQAQISSGQHLLESKTVEGKQVHNLRERQRLSCQTIDGNLRLPGVSRCTGHTNSLHDTSHCRRVEDCYRRLWMYMLLHTDSKDARLAR